MLIYGQERTTFTPKLKGLNARWTAKLKEGFTKVIEGGWLIPKKNYDRLKDVCESSSITIEEEKLKQLKPSSFEEEKPPHLESVSSRSHHPRSSEIDISDSDDEDYHRSLSAIKGVIASGKKVKKLSKRQEDRKRKISEDESSPKKRHGKKVKKESSKSESESKSKEDAKKHRSSRESGSESSYSSESEVELSSDIDSEEEDTRSLARRVRKIILYIKKHRN
jgi:hypothetical protein